MLIFYVQGCPGQTALAQNLLEIAVGIADLIIL